MAQLIQQNLPEAVKKLTDLKIRVNGDLTPLLTPIAALLENSTRKRFETKRDPQGNAWQQLTPSTIKRKTKRGKTRGGILVDRGDLLKSITSQVSNGKIHVGTDRSYAQFHQFGTKHREVSGFLGLSKQDEREMTELASDYIKGDL